MLSALSSLEAKNLDVTVNMMAYITALHVVPLTNLSLFVCCRKLVKSYQPRKKEEEDQQ